MFNRFLCLRQAPGTLLDSFQAQLPGQFSAQTPVEFEVAFNKIAAEMQYKLDGDRIEDIQADMTQLNKCFNAAIHRCAAKDSDQAAIKELETQIQKAEAQTLEKESQCQQLAHKCAELQITLN